MVFNIQHAKIILIDLHDRENRISLNNASWYFSQRRKEKDESD